LSLKKFYFWVIRQPNSFIKVVFKLSICLLNSSFIYPGADGTMVNCEHPEGGDSEDFKLEHIFDELFEGFSNFLFQINYAKCHCSELDIPVDVDRFCNEVIEEGIAAQNVGHGHGQTAEIVPMSAATIGGTFDGHKLESPRKAETTIMPIDAYGREGGEEVIILVLENLSWLMAI
jgi:hypothetical protein